MNRLIIIIFLSINLVGCFKFIDKPYKIDNKRINLNNSEGKKNERLTGFGTGGKEVVNTFFYNSVIEYGELCDKSGYCGKKYLPKQKDIILEAVNDYKDPLMVVIFIHGWNHNASDDIVRGVSRNYEFFPRLLARFDDQLVRRKIVDKSFEKPEVLGIYIGWPGKVSNKLIKGLSVGNRGCSADKISLGYKDACQKRILNKKSSEMKSDLLEIIAQVKRSNPNSKILIIGHSFGGRIVSNLFLDDLNKAVYNNQSNILGENVLISTINPAIGFKNFDNFLFKSFGSEINQPYWINFTSKNDNATKFLFPLARGTFLLQDKGMQTIGHKKSFITHDLTLQSQTEKKISCDQRLENNSLMNCWDAQRNFKIIEQIPIKFNWYSSNLKTLNFSVPFFERDDSNYAYQPYLANKGCLNNGERRHTCIDIELYEAVLKSRNKSHPLFYNISADSNLIGFDEEHRKKYRSVNPNHNGYISSFLTSLLINRLYN